MLPSSATGRTTALSPRRRAGLERLALVVCPPDVATGARLAAVVDQFALTLAVVAPMTRRLLLMSLDLSAAAFAVGSRLDAVPVPGVGRLVGRFAFPSPLHPLVRPVRDLLVTAYYDLPEVKLGLGCDPEQWTAAVMGERAARWADAIAAHDALILAPHPPPHLEP